MSAAICTPPAGEGESSSDLVFGGHNLIAENGALLAEARRFENQTVYGDIDVNRLATERRKMTTFHVKGQENYLKVEFNLFPRDTELTRTFPAHPFCTGRAPGAG